MMRALTLIGSLAIKSLVNRRGTALLTVASIAISVALLVGVNQIRTEAKTSFTNTLSGADLIVGARSGSINLLLYSIFRIGNPTGSVSWDSYQKIASRRDVAWTFPISLGDSHRGYRVLGTNQDYFEWYRYGGSQKLAFTSGEIFHDAADVVIGAEVARTLGYQIGDSVVVAHGIGATSFAEHGDSPFRVAGVLAPTGTPVDRTLHVTLEGIELMHDEGGDHQGEDNHDEDDDDHHHGSEHESETRDEHAAHEHDEPEIITAFVVGMTSRTALFGLQRTINDYRLEPLSAIIPGVALTELWSLVSTAELALLAVSGFVVLAGLIGLLTTLLTSLNERRREMAVLRSVGASSPMIFLLLIMEAALLALVGALLGVALTHLAMFFARDYVLENFGLFLSPGWPGPFDIVVVLAVTILAAVIAIIPAWRSYRYSLADGLTIRT
ncbi:MAG: ABC transporter permease [Lysobacterales bacterium]